MKSIHKAMAIAASLVILGASAMSASAMDGVSDETCTLCGSETVFYSVVLRGTHVINTRDCIHGCIMGDDALIEVYEVWQYECADCGHDWASGEKFAGMFWECHGENYD